MTPTSSAQIKRTLSRQCADLGIPVSGIFELTPRCNLRCKMCYVRLTPEQMAPIGRELTAQEWIDLGRQCKDAGLVFLLLTGGEPTLRKDFPQIYESLTMMGLSISINTNGTLITDEIKELWLRLPPAQVNITLYGVNEADYEALCGDGSAFSKVCEAIDWLQSQGILVHLNTTMTPVNYGKWVELEEFAMAHGCELRMTSYCFPPTRRGECSSCSDFTRLDAETAGELIALDILYREGIDSIRERTVHLGTPVQRSCELDVGDPIQCLAGRSQFWLTWHGMLAPCGTLSNPCVPLAEDNFLSAWEKLKTICKEIRLCPECTSCPEQKSCMNCAAVTFAETGRFDGKPEYMCRLNKAYREAVTKFAEAETTSNNQ